MPAVFKLPSLQEEIANMRLEDEIEIIKTEITTLFSQGTQEMREDSALIARMDACIKVLEHAAQNLKYRRALKTVSENLKKANTGTEARNETDRILANARKTIDTATNDIKKQANRIELKMALIEGYIIVNKLREYFYEPIEYKIISIGQASGTNVLLEANPTMAELLSNVQLENSMRGGIALKITETSAQFNATIRNLDQANKRSAMANTILSQMKQVQLNPNEQNLWDAFIELKERLSDIDGARINFGNITESFISHLTESEQITVDYVYDLLQKGRNNLAYYLGGDVGDYQVKALSAYGKTGRADVATLSNVLNPLRELRMLLTKSGDITESVKQFFTPGVGQGDRNFSVEAENAIRKEIEGVLRKHGITQ